jgi:hypothetical protein
MSNFFIGELVDWIDHHICECPVADVKDEVIVRGPPEVSNWYTACCDRLGGRELLYPVIYSDNDQGWEPARFLRRKKFPPNPDAVIRDKELSHS